MTSTTSTATTRRPASTSVDLLADPQFVEAAAYTTLADRVFPAPLPFDMPLAALRLQFEAWGTTLADALDVFGPPADARRERLGLNAAELSILTDSGFAALPEYFGEPAGASIDALNGAVANAKVFSRRVGVTYLELDRILKTRFVNPGVELVPLLVALHVGLDVIQSWLDGDTSDGELLDALPDDLDTAPYGDDVLAWLTANEALLMSLIVLAPTAEADPEIDDCDMGLRELRLARPVPGSNALTELEYHRLHRFIRLWRALERAMDADIETTDALVKTFLPIAAADLTPANLDDDAGDHTRPSRQLRRRACRRGRGEEATRRLARTVRSGARRHGASRADGSPAQARRHRLRQPDGDHRDRPASPTISAPTLRRCPRSCGRGDSSTTRR